MNNVVAVLFMAFNHSVGEVELQLHIRPSDAPTVARCTGHLSISNSVVTVVTVRKRSAELGSDRPCAENASVERCVARANICMYVRANTYTTVNLLS